MCVLYKIRHKRSTSFTYFDVFANKSTFLQYTLNTKLAIIEHRA